METYELIKEIPKPYSYKLYRSGLFRNDYQIMYEGCAVKYYTSTHEDVIELVALMNNVYTIGACDQIGRMQFIESIKKDEQNGMA
jgi:hypothetical protein